MRFTAADLERLSAAIQRLYAQPDLARLRWAIVNESAGLIRCDVATYNEVDPKSNKVEAIHNGSWTAKLLGGLVPALEAHLDAHPIHANRQSFGCDHAVRLSDFQGDARFRDSGLYREFYEPLGVRYSLN